MSFKCVQKRIMDLQSTKSLITKNQNHVSKIYKYVGLEGNQIFFSAGTLKKDII